MTNPQNYPAKLSIDYSDKLSRLTTFFRFFVAIPISFIGGGLSYGLAALNMYGMAAPGLILMAAIMGLVLYLIPAGATGESLYWLPLIYLFYIPMFLALSPLVMMILFKKKYPRWWYDWNVNLTKFFFRLHAYVLLLTDKYPSTDEEQSVHIEISYPDAEKELRRGMPIIKWILVIPHWIVLAIMGIAVWVVTIIAWFAILINGRYPKELFAFVVDYLRWLFRVWAYSFILTTDEYPPFSLG